MEQKKSYILLNQNIIDNCINSLTGNDYINYGSINNYQQKILITNIGAYYNAVENMNEHFFCLEKSKSTYMSVDILIATAVHNPTAIIRRFSELDVLIVYDLQYLSGTPKTQDKFIRILQNLIDNNKKIVLIGNVNPEDLSLKKELLDIINKLNVIDLTK